MGVTFFLLNFHRTCYKEMLHKGLVGPYSVHVTTYTQVSITNAVVFIKLSTVVLSVLKVPYELHMIVDIVLS